MFNALLARLRGQGSGGRIPTLFPDFPQVFDAPQDILRQIRDLCPDHDLLYFGWGKWVLVKYQPNTANIASGARRIHAAKLALRKWETDETQKANPGAFRRLYGRYLYWLMVCQGGRLVAEYTRPQLALLGFSYIVDDLRVMLWMVNHTSDNDVQRTLDAEGERSQAEALAQLTDYHAAKDVTDYLNKRTHAVTRHDDREKRRTRSGFTTIAAIGADGTHRSIA